METEILDIENTMEIREYIYQNSGVQPKWYLNENS